MIYAEYYIKQNVVSLNDIEIDVLKKPFFNSLLINRNFLNFINIHVIIEKEKTKNVKRKNVHLYKIKIKLIYNNNNNNNNNNYDKSEYLKNVLHQEKNSSVTQKYDYIESKSFNVKDKKREIYLNHNVNYKKDINIYNNNVNENIDNIERTNQYSKNYKMLFAQSVSSNASHYKNKKKCMSNWLTKSCDISDLLKEKNLFSQMFYIFENECFSKYIYLPSFISIRKANIKSIHFLLNNKLTIVLSLDLIVDKTNNNAFEINRNLELDNMLKLENNQIILCRTCNSNIINYSNVNSIMPHLYVNINNFFEHAFCEECTSFSYECLKDTRNTIIIFPNYLSFSYGIINKCNLSIKKNNLENYRHLFFCTNCYTPIGYLENNNKKNNFFGYNNKSINENIKNNIFQSIQQNNPDDYINIDHSNLLNISNKLYLNNTNKEDKTNIEHFNNNYINTLQKQKEKKLKENNIMMNNNFSSNNINIENDCKLNPNSETNHTNDNDKKDCHTKKSIQHNIIQKEGFINDDDINNNEQKTKEQCDPYDRVKFYIFKHKINIPLYKENIFKNYNDVLFLNEYIYNRNEKYNIQTFYITNNEKKYIIDIRIFIKQMYISSILQKICNNENLIFFQKVIKILYSIKSKREITCANAEVLNVSKGIYEDLLKILITYSYRSKIFKNKFVSYLPLVQ
ncbi:hypothetical protein PGSY75_1469500 [Plasmodium gaboni]|uniref:Uncharacterized protein n=1 Tax=Plasmodium gaboni TaxID=647221 RepID=A0A151LBD5_9APIC|nr:hypothetical protein PGSY75_1469500 [Plasmodium gaboni]KYN96280.1 hypothetical protein PGSY75_1469500 [Plasmodium gaboni]